MILVGYGGHAYVAYSIAKAMAKNFTGYCDLQKKKNNPFGLQYHGPENEATELLAANKFFIAIGENNIRGKLSRQLSDQGLFPINLVHPSSIICHSAIIAPYGLLIAANVVVNPLTEIGIGVICNTASVIEHECRIGDFAHIGPGAVLCGNVSVGKNTFIGAASVIRQGITIGDNATIGAGAVVVKDVPDNACVKGNPARS